MGPVVIRDVTSETLDDLNLCVPPERRDDPVFVRGIEAKRRWAETMLARWGTVGKIAYRGGIPIGLLQYIPVPAYRALYISCVFVPDRAHWRQGVATKLLDSLVADARRPQAWFEGAPTAVVVTRAFRGQKAGQLTAREFFMLRGFQASADPDVLWYPVTDRPAPAVVDAVVRTCAQERFWEEGPGVYVADPRDEGRALILAGPSGCPFAYGFWVRAERQLREVAPDMPIQWIDAAEEPEEVARRGGYLGCVVNARAISAFPGDRDAFEREVLRALNR